MNKMNKSLEQALHKKGNSKPNNLGKGTQLYYSGDPN